MKNMNYFEIELSLRTMILLGGLSRIINDYDYFDSYLGSNKV